MADSLSGPVGFAGEEDRAAVQLMLDDVNVAGGVDGHPVQLQVFDDRSDAKRAADNVSDILQSPALAVIGHYLSAASVQAGAGYKAGHIPAITGTASSDDVTKDNPYYFRAQTPTSMQAEFLAAYLRTTLPGPGTSYAGVPRLDLVSTDDAYGHSFAAGFNRGSAEMKPRVFVLARPLAASAAAVAEQLAQEPEPRIIVLGTAADANVTILQAIRRRGIRSRVILGSAAAASNFAAGFATGPGKPVPASFFNNTNAIAPMILDNTGALGGTFSAAYAARFGKQPSWLAAAASDTVRVLIVALRNAHPGNTEATRQADREAVRTALAAINTPQTAVQGINGPLFFNQDRNMPRAMRFGTFARGRLISAPLQLVQVQNPDLVDVDHETELGHIVEIDEAFFWLQRVVYTGIDILHVNRVDVREGTFNADIYLWMRYAGSDDVPTQVEFPDLNKRFDFAHPLESGTEAGLTYRLYHVIGDFKANYDLHAYPFDTQTLRIRLVSPDHPRDEVAYVSDVSGLQPGSANRASPAGSSAYRSLPLWHVVGIYPFVDAFTVQSTLGKPALFDTTNRTEYGGFDTEIVLQRNAATFMIKTLIPLFLLGLVVFATLFFPPALMTVRVTIPVTAILASAVLQVSVGNQLPLLGYTVALEYVFFVFFALCLMSMMTSVVSEVLRSRKAAAPAAVIDRLGRILYAAAVAATCAAFWWQYGNP